MQFNPLNDVAAISAHYAALRTWLWQAIGGLAGGPSALLTTHERWVRAELTRPDQPWRERLPVAVEASARWRAEGVERQRFIVGATFPGMRAALDRLDLPRQILEKLGTFAPETVQLGLARGPRGLSRRLYLEGGSLPAPMIAFEWQGRHLAERSYTPHAPLDMQPIGYVSPDLREAWADLLDGQDRGLLRADQAGDARAIHVALPRRPVAEKTAKLLAIARALRVPERDARAWLDGLPAGAELTVVALGQDRGLQLNVYVAPSQAALPQPGPPPGDLRRAPGTVLWPLQSSAGEPRGWLLFALPDAELPNRPAARSPGVQVFASSLVPDATRLAAQLAAIVKPQGDTLSQRLDGAEASLKNLLISVGLNRSR